MTVIDVPVRKAVVVELPMERAFRLFTEGIDRWWLRGHHIGTAELGRVVLEGQEGGRWYEVGVDGSECDWGYVLQWEPPQRLVLAWQIDGTWHFDPSFFTEVEVRFTAESPAHTRVEVEHRNLDRFGEAQERLRGDFDSPGGWQGLLDAFATAAEAEAA